MFMTLGYRIPSFRKEGILYDPVPLSVCFVDSFSGCK